MCPWLTHDPLDVTALLAEVASEGCGATTLFLGTVRRSADDGDVVGIEYSGYDAMAEAEFDRIVADARSLWPDARIALRHRLGYVATGEVSVAIAAAAPHRSTAFDACRFVIDQTKERVPIWKKERLAAGTEHWVGPHGG
jgi:molybdopterin synthase catalytic subunit